jgi:hypothetical protein
MAPAPLENRDASRWQAVLDGPPSVDPALRSLPLSDALADTYLSWCPTDRRPPLTPTAQAKPIRGRLYLGNPGRFGIGPLFDLQGQSGWLRMEAIWIDADPREQYLLCAIVMGRECPQRRVGPIHLWRVWQPTYSPKYVESAGSDQSPSPSMAAALDDAIETHLEQSLRSWVVHQFTTARNKLDSTINAITETIDRLDAERRHLRHDRRPSRTRRALVREQLLNEERHLEQATAALASLTPHPPPLVRQQLCEVQWFLAGPTVGQTTQ